MEPFSVFSAVAAPFARANIDTDAIIPIGFLRSPSKDVSAGLFQLWRYDADGVENPGYPLNQPRYRDAGIIVAGENFGCGSSREAAVWALFYAGFRCVIAPSFGDIFYENAFKNGLLAAIVSADDGAALLDWLQTAPEPLLDVDLARREIRRAGEGTLPFSVADNRREALLEGRDEIGTSLTYAAALDEFQATDRERRPWVYALDHGR